LWKLEWLKPQRDSSRYASLIDFGHSFWITKERLTQVQKHHKWDTHGTPFYMAGLKHPLNQDNPATAPAESGSTE